MFGIWCFTGQDSWTLLVTGTPTVVALYDPGPKPDVWSNWNGISRRTSTRSSCLWSTCMVCLPKLLGDAHRCGEEVLWAAPWHLHLQVATYGYLNFAGGSPTRGQMHLEWCPGRGRRATDSFVMWYTDSLWCGTWPQSSHTQLLCLVDQGPLPRPTRTVQGFHSQ